MAVQPLNQSTPFVGLGTSTFTAPVDGEYSVQVGSTLPPGSELQIVINHNGSPVFTIGGGTTNLGPSLGANWTLYCAAGDTLSAVLSSSAAPDQLANAVKSTVNIFQTQNAP